MTETLPTTFGDFSAFVVNVWPSRRRRTVISRATGRVVRHWGGPLTVELIGDDPWLNPLY